MNEKLYGAGESFAEEPKFYVWTYRHNYAGGGLYQLYVSVRGKMLIGTGRITRHITNPVLHKDIQALNYEFGSDGLKGSDNEVISDIYADVEIWRGAAVVVDGKGALGVVGVVEESGLVPNDVPQPYPSVSQAPVELWERAPRLINNCGASINACYNPKSATGADYAHPLDRAMKIAANENQKRAGDVQKEKRVRTFSTFGFRRAGVL